MPIQAMGSCRSVDRPWGRYNNSTCLRPLCILKRSEMCLLQNGKLALDLVNDEAEKERLQVIVIMGTLLPHLCLFLQSIRNRMEKAEAAATQISSILISSESGALSSGCIGIPTQVNSKIVSNTA